MAQKKCPCKKAAKHKKAANGRVAPVRAPTSTRVHHTKNSAKVGVPNINRGRITYQF